jgi:hypothetical protein
MTDHIKLLSIQVEIDDKAINLDLYENSDLMSVASRICKHYRIDTSLQSSIQATLTNRINDVLAEETDAAFRRKVKHLLSDDK